MDTKKHENTTKTGYRRHKKSGKIYIVECKPGKIGRPLQGVGQLIRYRVLIEKDLKGFKEKLKEKLKERLKNDQELQDMISKIDELKLRFYLAVPNTKKDRSPEWNKILKKCCKRLGFSQHEFRNILMFSDEDD